MGFTDKPCHRKQHQKHTPLIGGISIYFAILVTLFFNDNPIANQTAFITAATLLVCVGLIDDYKGLSVKIRLVAQITAALIMAEFAGIKITNIGDLLGFGDIQLGGFATAFTVFAVVGGINAFNMVDGIDGLAGSLALVSITSIAAVSWILQDWTLVKYCLIFMAAILAFLLFNLRIFGRTSAKIFLGDTGSTLFGFTICWFAVYASQGEKSLITPITVLWIIALPLADSVCIMLRRLTKGRSPFNPDREHLHHLFTVAGYSVNETLSILVAFSVGLCFVGLTASVFLGVPEPVLFLSFIFLFTCHYWLMTHAWTIMKISRYLRETKPFDRRAGYNREGVDKRSGIERRYIPTQEELDLYKNDGFSPVSYVRQYFRYLRFIYRKFRNQRKIVAPMKEEN
jgi:UDP-GlcNAc:undecaprenyl-phosphate GlcNAc-1-phosphate transferase